MSGNHDEVLVEPEYAQAPGYTTDDGSEDWESPLGDDLITKVQKPVDQEYVDYNTVISVYRQVKDIRVGNLNVTSVDLGADRDGGISFPNLGLSVKIGTGIGVSIVIIVAVVAAIILLKRRK